MNRNFQEEISPYLQPLKSYCIKLTRSTWDAEDLFQDVLLKTYTAIQSWPLRPITKAYLFRIATSTWIDICRKKSKKEEIALTDVQQQSESFHDLEIREAFDYLANQLTVRQMVYLLLVDIFKFTCKETAQLLGSTEGAIKEGVKRARKRLRTLHNEDVVYQASMRKCEDISLLDTFVVAFRKGNPHQIYNTYLSLISNGFSAFQVKKVPQNVIYFYFQDPNGHLICIRS